MHALDINAIVYASLKYLASLKEAKEDAIQKANANANKTPTHRDIPNLIMASYIVVFNGPKQGLSSSMNSTPAMANWEDKVN